MSPTLPLHWENYVVAFNQLAKYFWNTVLVTGHRRCRGTVSLVHVGVRLRPILRFQDTPYSSISLSAYSMVPFILTLVPAFVWIKQLGLLNTLLGVDLPVHRRRSGVRHLPATQLFRHHPQRHLRATATVERAGTSRPSWRIALPLTTPMLSVDRDRQHPARVE